MTDTRRSTVLTQDEADRALIAEAYDTDGESRAPTLVMLDLANALRDRMDADPHAYIALAKAVLLIGVGILVGGGFVWWVTL